MGILKAWSTPSPRISKLQTCSPTEPSLQVELVSSNKACGRKLSLLNFSDVSLDGSDYCEVDLAGGDLCGTLIITSQFVDLTGLFSVWRMPI